MSKVLMTNLLIKIQIIQTQNCYIHSCTGFVRPHCSEIAERLAFFSSLNNAKFVYFLYLTIAQLI